MYIKKISLLAIIILISFTSLAYSLELYSAVAIPINQIRILKDFSYLNILSKDIGVDFVIELSSKPLLPVTVVIDKAVTSSFKAKGSA